MTPGFPQERMAALDRQLLQLEQGLTAAAPGFMSQFPDLMADTARSMALVAADLRSGRIVADAAGKDCAVSLRQRAARIRALVERGDAYCRTRLSNLGVISGGYTANGAPPVEPWSVPRAEA